MTIIQTTASCDWLSVIVFLCWLPVKSRIEFKVLLRYKALNGQAPSYLTGLVVPYHLNRTLRPQNTGLPAIPGVAKCSLQDSAVSYQAPPFSLCKSVGQTRSSHLRGSGSLHLSLTDIGSQWPCTLTHRCHSSGLTDSLTAFWTTAVLPIFLILCTADDYHTVVINTPTACLRFLGRRIPLYFSGLGFVGFFSPSLRVLQL